MKTDTIIMYTLAYSSEYFEIIKYCWALIFLEFGNRL